MKRVFVANRGEIAVRIIEACKGLGLETVAGVSTVDRDGLAATLADRAVTIGPAPAPASYLNVDAVLAAALGTGCDAIHPGYGFLSESASFAARCAAEGLTWVGPAAEVIDRAGDKARARTAAVEANVPVLDGSGITDDVDAAVEAAELLGWPVLLKASAGGGGRGMSVCETAADLRRRFDQSAHEALQAFGDGRLYVERFVRAARHVEVQLMGDKHGNLVELGERDCSIQRRHQKIVEEAPASDVPLDVRAAIRQSAVSFGRAVGLDSAATAEFLYDIERGTYAFLELNARIQVEHPVTELVTGRDLVHAQLRVAAGEPLAFTQEEVRLEGHAVECRITAEAVQRNFGPSPGTITVWSAPTGDGVRVDSHCFAGAAVPPYYDSLIAKVITTGIDRDAALDRMAEALAEFRIEGVTTNLDLQRHIVADESFRAGRIDTTWVERQAVPDYLFSAEEVA